jgi:hypothetical protein
MVVKSFIVQASYIYLKLNHETNFTSRPNFGCRSIQPNGTLHYDAQHTNENATPIVVILSIISCRMSVMCLKSIMLNVVAPNFELLIK